MKIQLTNKWQFIGMIWLIFEVVIILVDQGSKWGRFHGSGLSVGWSFLFLNSLLLIVGIFFTNTKEVIFEQDELCIVNYNMYGIERTKKILNRELSYKKGVQARSGAQLILYRNGKRFEALSSGTFDKDGLKALEEELARFPEEGKKKY